MEIVTVGEIVRRYPDEWVLVEITRDHKDYRRVKGRVLAHSRDRDALIQPHHRFRTEHPDGRVFQFYAGPIVADEDVSIVLHAAG